MAPGLHRPDPERTTGLRRPKSPRKGSRFPDAAAPLGRRPKGANCPRLPATVRTRLAPRFPRKAREPSREVPSVRVRHHLGPSRLRAGHRAWGLRPPPPAATAGPLGEQCLGGCSDPEGLGEWTLQGPLPQPVSSPPASREKLRVTSGAAAMLPSADMCASQWGIYRVLKCLRSAGLW